MKSEPDLRERSEAIPSYDDTILSSINLDNGISRRENWLKEQSNRKDIVATKVVDLIIEHIQNGEFVIDEDDLMEEKMLVRIRGKILKSSDCECFDDASVQKNFNSRSSTKQLECVVRNSAKKDDYRDCLRRRHDTSMMTDTEVMISFLLSFPTLIPGLVYLYYQRKVKANGITFVIKNK